eukprot:TRINITY_DN5957_c0_g1_i1.p1 TRINITY_DN5957_c0_g1~~TRINITY_DN5957_c0_g1_i1.p1  ORF type:complete len:539 (+),score=64.60 TRINITY_DN5957_c0_g1_i1:52-1668(+)
MQICLVGSIAVVTLSIGQSLRSEDVSSPKVRVDDAMSSEAPSDDDPRPRLNVGDDGLPEEPSVNVSSKQSRGKRCLTIAGSYRVKVAGETVDDSFNIDQSGCMATASGRNLNGGLDFSIDDNVLKHGKYGILGMVQTNGDIVLDDNSIAERQDDPTFSHSLQHSSVVEKGGDIKTLLTTDGISNLSSGQRFCWKDTHERGIGSLPQRCARGHGKHGFLCFEDCPAGSERTWASGFACVTKCPKGWSEHAWQCRNSEYTRGVGYSYWNKDACARENPQGCEWHGSTYFPKCRPGYEAVGCCMCRPLPFKCKDFGDFAEQTDISCGKRVHGKMFATFGVCDSQMEMQAGMCYTPCPDGFDAVGPVCWSRPPVVRDGDDTKHWVNCGMGAAESVDACTSLFPMILGPVQVVADIATYGESSAAFKGATGSLHAGFIGGNIARLTGLTVFTSRALRELKRELFAAIRSMAKFSADIELSHMDEGPTAPSRTHHFAQVLRMAEEATSTEDLVAVSVAALALYNPLKSVALVFKAPSCGSIGQI